MHAYGLWIGRCEYIFQFTQNQNALTAYVDTSATFWIDIVGSIVLGMAIFFLLMSIAFGVYTYLAYILIAFFIGIIILLLNSTVKLKTVIDTSKRMIVSSYKLFFFTQNDTSEIEFEREEYPLDAFNCITLEKKII